MAATEGKVVRTAEHQHTHKAVSDPTHSSAPSIGARGGKDPEFPMSVTYVSHQKPDVSRKLAHTKVVQIRNVDVRPEIIVIS